MLQLLDHALKNLVFLSLALQYLDVRVQLLVQLLGVVQFNTHICHLVHLLLVYLDHRLVSLQRANLFLEIVELSLQTVKALLVLPLD